MLFRFLFASIPAIFILFVCSTELNAQTTTSGGLTGVVSDPSHAVVPDATVEIRDDSKGTIQSIKTDSDGVYAFFFVAAGSHTLKWGLSGCHGGVQTTT